MDKVVIMINKIIKHSKSLITRIDLPKQKLIALGASGVVLGIALIFIVVLSSSHNKASLPESVNAPTKAEASELQESITAISQGLSRLDNKLSSAPSIDITPIRESLHELTQKTQQLAKDSRQEMEEQIQKSTSGLEEKLKTISKALDNLQQEQAKTTYISSHKLPFHVIHIDNIIEQDVVTVEYAEHFMPLNIGDYLASWRLIRADFSNQQAEFVNNNNQHVLVDINENQQGKA